MLTAPLRPDHIFGFGMFPEASTMEIHLGREIGGARLAAPHGEWIARDRTGTVRTFSWHDRVRDPILAALDLRVFASYGLDAQLARLERALDDVSSHIPDDAETTRLVAEVVVRRNGQEARSVTVLGPARGIP